MDWRFGLVLFLGTLSVGDSRLTNVTFTNLNGQFTLMSANWPNNAPAVHTHMWQLTSPPGTSITLTCPDIRILKRVGCAEGSLTIWDGLTQINICTVVNQYRRESIGSRMFVQFRTGVFGVGRFLCVARIRSLNAHDVIGEEPNDAGSGVGLRQPSCPCGWTNRRRIVGGVETGINEYVFMASIRHVNTVHGFCGGSIISRRHILTAAHCLHGNNRRLQVVVGDHDVTTARETFATQVIEVQQNIMHEDYNHNEMTHDIAILVLARDITYNQFVGPICLPAERYNLLNRSIKVLGWGKLSTNGAFSNVLRKVNLQVVDLRRCSARYTNHIDLQNPVQICTYTPNKDSCQGDSGGPLIYHDPEMNRYVQVAIVSYGRDCASEDPAVNVDLFPYFNWIQEIVGRLRQLQNVNTCEKI